MTDSAPEQLLQATVSVWIERLLERRGIEQVVASPRRPQTLGKIERFWGAVWRECVEAAIFRRLDDARQRIGLFVDHDFFQRPHSGIDGRVPVALYLAAAPQVLEALRARVVAHAEDLVQHGISQSISRASSRWRNRLELSESASEGHGPLLLSVRNDATATLSAPVSDSHSHSHRQ